MLKHILLSVLYASFIVLFFSCRPSSPKASPSKDLILWYDEPATAWTEALPIGNGRLGAMVYGDVQHEHVQFNEETLWTGKPRIYAREGAVQYLPQIRQLLAQAKQAEAEALAKKHFMGMQSNEQAYPQEKAAWLKGIESYVAPAAVDYDDTAWHTMELPASQGWESIGFDGLDGAVWLRKTFTLPQAWSGERLVLQLGRIRDRDNTYLNGKKIGTTEGGDNREYILDASLLHPGENVIAIQVINFYDKGGLTGANGENATLGLRPQQGNPEPVSLSGAWQYWIQDDLPPAYPRYEAAYQPFGDVWITQPHDEPVKNYKRSLDLTTATSSVLYTVGNINYQREYLISQPKQAMVMHYSADGKGSISLHARFSTPHRHASITAVDSHTLKLMLQVQNGALKGVAYLQANVQGGTVQTAGDSLVVENADDVTFYLTAATNYKNYQDVSADADTSSRQPLAGLQALSYNQLKEEHIQEYQPYFNTLSLDLGHTDQEQLPTDERLKKYTHTTDPSLISLYLQYGRYLLIASSRPGTGPANLQGIWNDRLTPPWDSKYTTNINTQMNYWPADLLNLSPCLEPFLQLTEEVAEAGIKTAQQHYGAHGWVLHHNTDVWRGTAPINAANHGIWVTGGAWLCHRLWDHYLFTQDSSYLAHEAYPVMKQAAAFFVDFLVKDPKTGWLISTPGNSPEQGGLVAGATMDHQIIRDLFKNCIQAAAILKTDVAFADTLKTMQAQIAPNQIGQYGQLQEWLEDKDDPDNHHRHVSHMWGVYPGTDITTEDTTLLAAAKKSLMFRGDEGTGWSLAWKVNLWARLKDGDHTLAMIDRLLQPSVTEPGVKERGGAYFNLFDAHPPFQIDGNFGGAAGIAEMLIQSHMPYIELLPALPTDLPTGTLQGVCARGGFVFTIQWAAGKLQQVKVTSHGGRPCTLRYQDRQVTFNTEKDKVYVLNGALEKI